MEKQQTFSEIEYAGRKRVGRRERFLETMEKLVPWVKPEAKIAPHYYAGKRGRPPIGIQRILRMYLLRIWFNLSDEGVGEAIHDSYAMKQFMGISFDETDAPDAATLLSFRQLPEQHQIQQEIPETVNEVLQAEGKMMRGGSIVGATIVEAPGSTKNRAKSRNGAMKQAKKGNVRHFGFKAHVGVDAGTGMVHHREVTAADVADITVAHKLIREDDDVVNGDAGYTGLDKRKEIAEDPCLSQKTYRINKRKGQDRKREARIYKAVMEHLNYIKEPNWDAHIEYMKSKERSKVEHVFYIIKGLFGYRKAAYRGLEKNKARMYMLCASANLLRWAWSLRPLRRYVVS